MAPIQEAGEGLPAWVVSEPMGQEDRAFDEEDLLVVLERQTECGVAFLEDEGILEVVVRS